MFVNLHATQKIMNEDGTTSVLFIPSIVDGEEIYLKCDNIYITLPTAADPFIIGADYTGELTKSEPQIEPMEPPIEE